MKSEFFWLKTFIDFQEVDCHYNCPCRYTKDKCADECSYFYGGKMCGKDGKTYKNACMIKCKGVVSWYFS